MRDRVVLGLALIFAGIALGVLVSAGLAIVAAPGIGIAARGYYSRRA